MGREVTLEELLRIVDSGGNFQVIDYSGSHIVIDEVRGIVKVSDEEIKGELAEIRKRRPRGKPTREQIGVTKDIVTKLVEGRVRFKVIFGPREVTIRFDLDHYIRLTEDDVRIVGFRDRNDGVLRDIASILEKYGPLKMLRRMS